MLKGIPIVVVVEEIEGVEEEGVWVSLGLGIRLGLDQGKGPGDNAHEEKDTNQRPHFETTKDRMNFFDELF